MKLMNHLLCATILFCITCGYAQATYVGHYTVKTVFVDELSQTVIRFYEDIELPTNTNCKNAVNSVALPDYTTKRESSIVQQKLQVAMDSLQSKTKVAIYIYDQCAEQSHQLASIGATNEFAPLMP